MMTQFLLWSLLLEIGLAPLWVYLGYRLLVWWDNS